MTPAEIDALIAELRDEAHERSQEDREVGLFADAMAVYLLTCAAAALAECREQLAQMAEVEGRADQVCKINDEMRAQIAALRADAERLRLEIESMRSSDWHNDAERYRALREECATEIMDATTEQYDSYGDIKAQLDGWADILRGPDAAREEKP